MKWYQRICPHWFGWSYNTYRRRRWCRVCAKQRRQWWSERQAELPPVAAFFDEGGVWLDVTDAGRRPI
jgi:hypothetical protein